MQILSNITKKDIYADNNRFSVNELKCALNPENVLNARIVVTDAKGGEMLIRKKYLYQMILSLCENRPIPKYLNIKGNLIPLQRALMINTQISLSPYIIDNILQENENTYTYNEETKTLINSPYNYRNDLYEYIKVKDIYNRSLFVRKPFIRQILCKGKIIENVTTLDFEGYSRILSVIEIIKNKYSNSPEIEIDDKYIYYEIENKLYSKSLIKQKKESYREWVQVEDKKGNITYIYKSKLIEIIRHSMQSKQIEYKIADNLSEARIINISKVLYYLH